MRRKNSLLANIPGRIGNGAGVRLVPTGSIWFSTLINAVIFWLPHAGRTQGGYDVNHEVARMRTKLPSIDGDNERNVDE